MACRKSNPGVPERGLSASRYSGRDGDALYDELDRNHFRVRCWPIWIHGYRTLHGAVVSELYCVLTRDERRMSIYIVLGPQSVTYTDQVHKN